MNYGLALHTVNQYNAFKLSLKSRYLELYLQVHLTSNA